MTFIAFCKTDEIWNHVISPLPKAVCSTVQCSQSRIIVNFNIYWNWRQEKCRSNTELTQRHISHSERTLDWTEHRTGEKHYCHVSVGDSWIAAHIKWILRWSPEPNRWSCRFVQAASRSFDFDETTSKSLAAAGCSNPSICVFTFWLHRQINLFRCFAALLSTCERTIVAACSLFVFNLLNTRHVKVVLHVAPDDLVQMASRDKSKCEPVNERRVRVIQFMRRCVQNWMGLANWPEHNHKCNWQIPIFCFSFAKLWIENRFVVVRRNRSMF